MKYEYQYLLKIQFLGFRFHGWQKQKNIKTVHEAVDKTIDFTIDNRFKTFGIGRTDSKVSSSLYLVQLFSDEIIDRKNFLINFNKNAPSDLKVIAIKDIDRDFNIIQSKKVKVYHYYFSNQGKNHPYAAPYMVGFSDLNIDLMKQGAKLFEGYHYFGNYCTKPSPETKLDRQISHCSISENTFLTASFFPSKSYVLKVKGSGFLRYQIRLMMGALIELGKGDSSLQKIKESLNKSDYIKHQKTIAPASGLHLYDVIIEDKKNLLN